MERIEDPLSLISELLNGRATPTINPQRVAPSVIYDLQYRIAIIASAFELHARTSAVKAPRIQSVRLKLLQFVACRAALVRVVELWSKTQKDAQLSMDLSQRLRRGFLTDQMHDDVVDFLTACGALAHSGQYLISGPSASMLSELHNANEELGLFATEREALQRLKAVRITNAMLEGW